MDHEDNKEICKEDAMELQEIEQEIVDVDPEALEDISPSKKQQIVRLISTMISSTHSGPLPRPEDLEKYNLIIPDGADRIMKMAENQSQHRLQIEKDVIRSDNNQSAAGQWMAFILSLVGFGASIFLGYNGHDWLAGTIATSVIIGLAFVFIKGKNAQHPPDSEKNEN